MTRPSWSSPRLSARASGGVGAATVAAARFGEGTRFALPGVDAMMGRQCSVFSPHLTGSYISVGADEEIPFGKTAQAEVGLRHVDIGAASLDNQIRHQLPHRRRQLVTVTAESGAQQHLFHRR